MANPRQKRKQRSSTAKAGISKQSKKNLKKVTIKGPAILTENWDKTKTVRQNYAALGLLPRLDPRQTGGIEPEERVPTALATATAATVEDLDAAMAAADGASSDEDDEDEVAVEEKKEETEPLKPGMARIVRDAQGNVVSIIVGGADGEEVEEKVRAPERTGESSDEEEDSDVEEAAPAKKGTGWAKKARGKPKAGERTPWGAPMKDWDAAPANEADFGALEGVTKAKDVRQGIPIFGAPRDVEAKTDVVRVLEERASHKTKVIRHTSQFEHEWLVSLVGKHGDDIAAMARDRKGNVWQKTPGELRRAIAKAGGLEKLKALAQEA
ncbi:Nucleolar protein 16 [Rhodotorula kratochvilovae]